LVLAKEKNKKIKKGRDYKMGRERALENHFSYPIS
jgi:hypothetical protein